MARSAPGLGLHAIDLGKGEARYKTSMMTSALGVAEGAIELPSVAAAVGRVRRRARTLARRSGLGAPLRTAARRVARVAQGQRRR
jgi:CelD/BcsL family acetyltransferase involved in cellulose biosynthesis